MHKTFNETKAELKRKSDNETLLLKYPDLYGPLENLSENESNVLEDMLNQVNANKHRISLLENLNGTLMTSIKKLNEANVRSNSQENSRKPSIDIQYENSHSQQQQQHRYTMQSVSRNEHEESLNRSSHRRQISPGTGDAKFPPRPMPLFKLDNELSDPNTNKPLSADKTFKKSSWSQNESVVARPRSNSMTRENEYETFSQKASGGFDTNKNYEDEEFNFLKGKDESNRRLLDELNMIGKTSELNAEMKDFEDFDYMKIRRNIPSSLSRMEDQSYLNSPTSVGNNTLRNQTPSLMIQNSRMASYSPSGLNRQANSRLASMTPIPPADKNMEVVVGKGRRVNSASGSTRSNSNQLNQQHSNGTSNKAANTASIPPTPTGKVSRGANLNGTNRNGDSHRSSHNQSRISDFRCKKCEKAYNNLRDFDIHKLYCN